MELKLVDELPSAKVNWTNEPNTAGVDTLCDPKFSQFCNWEQLLKINTKASVLSSTLTLLLFSNKFLFCMHNPF